MKNILEALLMTVSISSAAVADPIYVIRPAISSKKVLPQNAFAGTDTPSTPAPSVPPGENVVFTSAGYDANLPPGKGFSTVMQWSGVNLSYNAPFGYAYCKIVDDAAGTTKSKLEFRPTGSNQSGVPQLAFRTFEAGIYKIVMACGSSPNTVVPVDKAVVDSRLKW